MKVALVVDNPYRDLPGLVLVAMKLCQQGAQCFLVPMWFQQELWTLAPDFALLNYLRPNNQELARQLSEAGIGIGVLDSEGGVLVNFDDYAMTLAPDHTVRGRVGCFLCWGTKLAEHAEQAGWYGRSQLVVTGTPRLDFYSSRWRPAAMRCSPQAGNYPQPMVLVNGNFPVANPCFQTPDQEAQMLVEKFGYDSDYVIRWQNVERETMTGMAALTNALAAQFPKVSFVYRPHPFEKVETYHNLLHKRENLYLVKQGSVDGWIVRACAVIQRGCSTAIEAGLAGVPALSPVWIPTPVQMHAAEVVSLCTPSEQVLVSTLQSILDGKYSETEPLRRNLEQVISNWFYQIDGKAHERVTTAIVRHVPLTGESSRIEGCRCRLYTVRGPSLPAKKRLRAVAMSVFGLPPDWSFRRLRQLDSSDFEWWRKTEKYFGVKEVQLILDALHEYAGGETPRIMAAWAHGLAAYHFGFASGQSVAVFAERN